VPTKEDAAHIDLMLLRIHRAVDTCYRPEQSMSRKINQLLVLYALGADSDMTLANIVKATGLSRSTADDSVAILLDQKAITPRGDKYVIDDAFVERHIGTPEFRAVMEAIKECADALRKKKAPF
jgi:DNA-binding IclR family transcriptional regulator